MCVYDCIHLYFTKGVGGYNFGLVKFLCVSIHGVGSISHGALGDVL